LIATAGAAKSSEVRSFALFALVPFFGEVGEFVEKKKVLESMMQLQLRCRDEGTAFAVLVCCDAFAEAEARAMGSFAKHGVVELALGCLNGKGRELTRAAGRLIARVMEVPGGEFRALYGAAAGRAAWALLAGGGETAAEGCRIAAALARSGDAHGLAQRGFARVICNCAKEGSARGKRFAVAAITAFVVGGAAEEMAECGAFQAVLEAIPVIGQGQGAEVLAVIRDACEANPNCLACLEREAGIEALETIECPDEALAHEVERWVAMLGG
jgi:hypothetical protein